MEDEHASIQNRASEVLPNNESICGNYDVMASFVKDNETEMEIAENPTAFSISEEIRVYTDMKTEPVSVNVLNWWTEASNQLPLLSKAARFVMSVPASSAAPERTFSTGSFVVSERRSLLSPSTVENILICHANNDLERVVNAENTQT